LAYEPSVGYSSYGVQSGLEVVRDHMQDGTRIIGHNIIQADLPRLLGNVKSFGPDHIVDTKVVAHLIHAHWAELGLYSLADLVKYYGPTTDWKRDKGDSLEYNGRDVAYNFKLWEALQIDLTLTDQWHLVEKDQRLAHLTWEMHERGIKIDSNAIREFNKKWVEGRTGIANALSFNPNSPKQILAFLKNLNIKANKTSANILEKHRGKHSEIDLLLDYKDMKKGLKSWYDDEAIERGWIYPQHNVTGTAVARFSSSGPNVQNIPPWAKFAILPNNEEEYLFNTDAKNLEGRTVAFHANDRAMLADFKTNLDIHKLVASRVFRKRFDEVEKLERQVGKTVVHASNYVEGPNNLAGRLYGDATKANLLKATQIQNAYFKEYFATKSWHQSIAAQLDRGDIMLANAFGRKRFIYAQNSHERVKRGTHFLGCSSGAEVVNQKVLDIRKELGLIPLAIVHDSNLFSLPKGEAGLKLEKQIAEIQNTPLPEFQGEVEFPWKSERGLNYKELKNVE